MRGSQVNGATLGRQQRKISTLRLAHDEIHPVAQIGKPAGKIEEHTLHSTVDEGGDEDGDTGTSTHGDHGNVRPSSGEGTGPPHLNKPVPSSRHETYR